MLAIEILFRCATDAALSSSLSSGTIIIMVFIGQKKEWHFKNPF